MLEDFKQQLILNFVTEDRWRYLANGLLVTLKLTFFAVLLGLVIGFTIAIIRNVHDNTGKLKFLNFLCNVYLTIIRGTPVVVQLMIIYFVIFGSVRIDKALTAILAFGINSGAYQAEIFRSGIQSIPRGQMEAGRSLNEVITLLKETSVAGYIALEDLTKGGDIIRSRTYSAFMPLIAVALIYLIMVLILERIVKLIERRLSKNDKR